MHDIPCQVFDTPRALPSKRRFRCSRAMLEQENMNYRGMVISFEN